MADVVTVEASNSAANDWLDHRYMTKSSTPLLLAQCGLADRSPRRWSRLGDRSATTRSSRGMMFEIASTAMPIRNQLRRSVSLCYRAADGESDAGNRHWLILRRAYRTGDRALQLHTDPLFRQRVSIWVTSRTIFVVWPLSLEPRRPGWPAWSVPKPATPTGLTGKAGTVRSSNRVWPRRGRGWRNAPTPRQCRAASQERPCPHRPISSAPSPARARVRRAGYRPPRWEALTEAARAIWRGIEVLEGWIGANGRASPDPSCGRCQRHRFQLAD